MIVVGLVGEAPNDTNAIKNLLSRNYQNLNFVTLLKNINGSMLDNNKAFRRILRIEYETQTPDLIIFIRDLDSLETDREAKLKRQETFNYSNNIVDKKGVFLLHIYEIEALIFADVETFNKHYGSSISKVIDPMRISEPKEELIKATKKSAKSYSEAHNAKIFDLLNFNILKSNCRYFNDFIRKLDAEIALVK